MKVLLTNDVPCQEIMGGSLSLSTSRQLISFGLNANSLPFSSILVDTLLGKLGICNSRYIQESVSHLARETSRMQHLQGAGENLKELARLVPDDIQK